LSLPGRQRTRQNSTHRAPAHAGKRRFPAGSLSCLDNTSGILFQAGAGNLLFRPIHLDEGGGGSKARFVLGLCATVARKDGHHPIIFMQCGPVRHRVDDITQASVRPFEHNVIVKDTGILLPEVLQARERIPIHEIYSFLMNDTSRNDLIVADVLDAVGRKRSPLVLAQRTEHLHLLAERLGASVKNVLILKGGMGKRQRAHVAETIAAIPECEERVLVATGRYLGEGFDDARLDTLFLTLPISWRGTLAQYAGRLHRSHHLKKEVIIYDYADLSIPMLVNMYKRRLRGYRAIGYTIKMVVSDPVGRKGA